MNVCDTHWASGGPKVKAFEDQWKDLFEYEYSVAMSSGTDGVINACLALYDLKNAKRGVSEVIVPALSFIATSNNLFCACTNDSSHHFVGIVFFILLDSKYFNGVLSL